MLCAIMGLRGCTEVKTVPQKEKWPGQAVMADQQRTSGDAVGLRQGHVQQGSTLSGPVAVRASGKRWQGWRWAREMKEKRARPPYHLNRRTMKGGQLWMTGYAENQSQVEKKKKMPMMGKIRVHQRKREMFLLTTLFHPPSCHLSAPYLVELLPVRQGSDWLQECLDWGHRWL